jgi:DNA-binding GntR family transcriptional regulator
MNDQTASRAEMAYQALRQAIIEQALQPGARLPEDELGGHFGMSRTLARAVLARLQAEGLVETAHKKTARVACPSLEEARAVFEVRRTLEREVVRLVVKHWRPEFGAALEGHVREEEQARERHDERLSIRLAGEFHLRLAAMSGNPLMQRYVSETVSRCSLILALYGRPHSSECGIHEHRRIIDALRAGDPETASAVMDHHVGAVEERALIREGGKAPELGAVLARYVARQETARGTARGTTPLAPRRSGRKPS